MSKQNKRPVEAVTGSAQATPSPHIPSSQRDKLTGEPLPKVRSVVYPVRDFNPHRLKNRKPLPMQLHRNVADGLLGGCQWTRQMANYVGPIKTSSNEDRLRWFMSYWWMVPFAEAELRACFSRDAVDCVLAIHRDGMDWYDAARWWQRSIEWVVRQDGRMAAHMRRMINISFW